jgi:hypothetical protein
MGSLTSYVNIHRRLRNDARHVPMQDSELWSNWSGNGALFPVVIQEPLWLLLLFEVAVVEVVEVMTGRTCAHFHCPEL